MDSTLAVRAATGHGQPARSSAAGAVPVTGPPAAGPSRDLVSAGRYERLVAAAAVVDAGQPELAVHRRDAAGDVRARPGVGAVVDGPAAPGVPQDEGIVVIGGRVH